MENDPFIDGLPNLKNLIFHGYQMVEPMAISMAHRGKSAQDPGQFLSNIFGETKSVTSAKILIVM